MFRDSSNIFQTSHEASGTVRRSASPCRRTRKEADTRSRKRPATFVPSPCCRSRCTHTSCHSPSLRFGCPRRCTLYIFILPYLSAPVNNFLTKTNKGRPKPPPLGHLIVTFVFGTEKRLLCSFFFVEINFYLKLQKALIPPKTNLQVKQS